MHELFNYALYDAPDVVRDVIGLGGPMDRVPQMLQEQSLMMVWAPMVRVLADLLEVELDGITTSVERRPLERTIEVDGMGTFEEGTLGAFRFEVTGVVVRAPGARDGARHPHRRRLRTRLAPSRSSPAASTGSAIRATPTWSSACTAPNPANPVPPVGATPPPPTAS